MIQDITPIGVSGSVHAVISAVTLDSRSRDCKPGSLFVACRGHDVDGHRFARGAVAKGASALLVERWIRDCPGVTQIKVEDTRQALSKVAARYYGFPSKFLKLFAVTGTNGKSTTASLLAHLLRTVGSSMGLVGTVQYEVGNKKFAAPNTTPDSLRLQELLAEMVKHKLNGAVLEVSSHALTQRRVDGLSFAAGIFTNLSRDHLDYHGSMAQYFSSKRRLFTKPLRPEICVLNVDDPYGRRLARSIRGRRITFAIGRRAALRARILDMDLTGSRWRVEHAGKRFLIESPLVGLHNISNTLGALGGGLAAGYPLGKLIKGARSFTGVSGRLERFGKNKPFYTFVDYAHTEDALNRVLATLRKFCRRRLIVAFGCGGDRDRGKRPRMGRVAGRWADLVILTSDNPRSEDPSQIIADIRRGMGSGLVRCLAIPDRKTALHEAFGQAREGDLVLVTGKGHETTQMYRDVTVPMDDRKLVRQLVGA